MLLLASATALIDSATDEHQEHVDQFEGKMNGLLEQAKSHGSDTNETSTPDKPGFGKLPDVPEPRLISPETPSTNYILAEVQTMFGVIEQEIANIQETIKLDLPGDESESYEPASKLSTPEDAKWYAQPAVWVAAAVAGSGAAFLWVTGSSAAATGARKPIYSPLFTRFEGEKVLDHPRRAQLYAAVSEQPGIRLQDLCEETQLSRTAVTHHLRLLEQQHVVVSKRVGRSRHFFENGGRYASSQKEAYALLQNDRSRSIMDLIRSEPGIIQKGICEHLELQASIAHWHIKRLTEAGLIDPIKQGRTVQYYANAVA